MRRVVLLLPLVLSCSSTGASGASGSSGPEGVAVSAPGVGHDETPGVSTSTTPTGSPIPNDPPPNGRRDWKAHPAIVDVAAPATLYALSDVHGGFDRLAALLVANGIVSKSPTSSTDAHWGAGAAMLVVAGDLIDKGPSSVEVLDFFMALQADAKKSGGSVIVTLGNHEAEFLVDPTNAKASRSDGIATELSSEGVAPASLASGLDPRGAWLRLLPFGVRAGGWFFSHAGDTQGRSVAALETALEAAVTAHPNYDDPEIVGASSILESRDWYSTTSTATTNAAALGVKHIVFGHDPHAIGGQGKIAVDSTSTLVRIDCGMSPDVDYSTGMILRVTQQGSSDVVEQLDANGNVKSLFTAPR